MFSFIKNKLQKIFTHITSKLGEFFNKKTVDEATLKELEVLLLASDVGVSTTRTIIADLKKQMNNNTITGVQLKEALHAILLSILTKTIPSDNAEQRIFLFVGINGSGKTTSIGKLAHYYTQQKKKVLLVAADTFRAAATEQLAQWALTTHADILCGQEGQDPAALVY